jgi:transcription elongation factor Elf1
MAKKKPVKKKPREFTPEEIKTYMDGGKLECPFCKKSPVYIEEHDVTDDALYQIMSCGACEKSWIEEYTITRMIENLEEP